MRVVIVQPTTYGLDNRCQIEAAAEFGDLARLVVVVNSHTPATELERLRPMVEDGLVKIEDGVIEVLPAGRLLIRNVCMVFDRYLSADGQTARYSKVI